MDCADHTDGGRPINANDAHDAKARTAVGADLPGLWRLATLRGTSRLRGGMEPAGGEVPATSVTLVPPGMSGNVASPELDPPPSLPQPWNWAPASQRGSVGSCPESCAIRWTAAHLVIPNRLGRGASDPFRSGTVPIQVPVRFRLTSHDPLTAVSPNREIVRWRPTRSEYNSSTVNGCPSWIASMSRRARDRPGSARLPATCRCRRPGRRDPVTGGEMCPVGHGWGSSTTSSGRTAQPWQTAIPLPTFLRLMAK